MTSCTKNDEICAEDDIVHNLPFNYNYDDIDFYTKNEYLRDRLSISRNTASKYLNELENLGILTSEQVGKEKIYKNNYLYELMKEW